MAQRTIRLLFVDEGSYHREDVAVPADAMDRYERLIDFLREEPEVLRDIYVDVERLCAAWIVEEGDDAGDAGEE